MIFSRQPCFRPRFDGAGQIFIGVDGQDDHVGFGGGGGGVLPQRRITQVIEFPPGAFKIEVVEQSEAIAETQSAVPGSDVVVSNYQLQGIFRVPRRISQSGVGY